MLSFSNREHSFEFRYESAIFIQQMYRTSALTLQMFLSSNGLNSLLLFIKEDYGTNRDFVFVGVEGIWKLLRQQDYIPKNDICTMVVNDSLEPLTKAMLKALATDDDSSRMSLTRICEILLALSQADNYVKESLLCESALRRILRILLYLPHSDMAITLQFFKQLSMVPSSLSLLRKVHIIPLLTHILGDSKIEKGRKEIRSEALAALFNVCKLDKKSQEEAVISGAIPLLQEVIIKDRLFKEFALPILLALPQAGPVSRIYLWQNKCLDFFLSLLSDLNWQSAVFDTIASWLQFELREVQRVLAEKRNVQLVLKVFCISQSASSNRMLDTLGRVCQISPRLAASYGQPIIFQKFKEKLTHKGTKPIVVLNIFQIMKSMCEASSQSVAYIAHCGLPDVVANLNQTSDSVLVKELAKDLLKYLKVPQGPINEHKSPISKPHMPPPRWQPKQPLTQ